MSKPAQHDYQKLFHRLLREALLFHPLPWRLEWDWTCEVTASDGFIVAKVMDQAEGLALIAEAELVQAVADKAEAVIDAVLENGGGFSELNEAFEALEEAEKNPVERANTQELLEEASKDGF